MSLKNVIIFFSAFSVITGCADINEKNGSEEAVVKFSECFSRTILPSVEQENLKEIRLTVKENDETILERNFSDYNEFVYSEIKLVPASYTFSVTAVSGGCLFTSGKVKKEIKNGLNFLNFRLFQSSVFSINGNGAVNISAVFEEEPEVPCFARFEFLLLPQLEFSGAFSSEVVGKEAHVFTEIEAGSYILRTTVYSNSGGKIKSGIEAVRVADGLVTSGVINLGKPLALFNGNVE
ncbi:MAG: hypothetical protein J5780_05160 [Treponema sp.]|nr:hypothetical protein [Treponema sp.]